MHDNPLLSHAATLKGEIVPVFCWDDRDWNKETEFNSRKAGILRCRFYTEATQELRKKLEGVGLNLLSAFEHPEDFIPSLMDNEYKTVLIYQKEADPNFSKVEE
jgi:deoxyribodipyrimidine photolyase